MTKPETRIAADPKNYQFDLPFRPEPAPLAETIHKRAWAVAGTVASLRGGPPEETVRLIVIHATAGSTTDGAVSVMAAGRASFHWVVPGKDEPAHGRHVWATCPERLAAWHVRRSCAHPDICDGANNLNRASLGIEVVNRQDGEDPFSDWQIEAAAAIVRYAWAKYPNLAHVTSHARLDPGRRTDPGVNFPWTEFMERVRGR
ncbi:N-acetylmuramoyl-L-alanine amidase [Hyphococcus luteus]|uniref:N-acetylmuramoyl-L-alanine amidase n=1 Tax=Hyphococcus luteus TaxID=2058213 RepID=A0A2S7K781_9PROT|nr:N-acetylmuramoyl-L-alanine amidase [Marinicaulis flavus]PQA88373.1 N-acetylmuramoyl-L-alanine amidase [Marinicaulis flavus]